MKRLSFISLILAIIMVCSFAFVACDGEAAEAEGPSFVTKDVDLYNGSDEPEKTVPLRFYEDTPNVPYIGVNQFFTEFYQFDLKVEKKGKIYTYYLYEDTYISFDTRRGLFKSKYLMYFSYADFFVSSSSQTFVFDIPESYDETEAKEQVVSLKDYGIAMYAEPEEKDVYVPIAFLTIIAGGPSWYSVGYNGEALYVFDGFGNVSGVEYDYTIYENYLDVIVDMETERPADVIDYTYKLLCLDFDNFRGYTAQLLLGDERLLEYGLDGALDNLSENFKLDLSDEEKEEYVSIKDALLSPDKATYLAGYYGLFFVLDDGGHTSSLTYDDVTAKYLVGIVDIQEAYYAYLYYYYSFMDYYDKMDAIALARIEAMGVAYEEDDYGDLVMAEDEFGYYYYDEASKTAYIGFDSYETDFIAWDEFYTEGLSEEYAPVETDTYAFIRAKLYQALEDGAENVVFDDAANEGGINYAVYGILGLLNEGVAYEVGYNRNNDVYSYREIGIDIDLDGDFDDDDVEEAKKFKALNYGILTSACSFSNGNTLPFYMQELGYKVIGERSGGGNCNIFFGVTVDGLTYCMSGFSMVTDRNHNNFDEGVTPDLELEIWDDDDEFDFSAFYDFEAIAAFLKSADEE